MLQLFHVRWLPLIAFLLAFSLEVKSEHIIGGEMYYECNGDGTYTFTMKLYRDCNSSGAEFDNPANFAVFNDNNILITQVQEFVLSEQEIDPNFNSPCLEFPPDICVEEGTYEFTLTLDTDVSGYQVVYQRCCRNQTVQNLDNPGAQGLTIVAEVPSTNDAVCNSSPVFNNFPPPVLCSFEELVFDHSATDPDGDELVYSLCSPYIGGTQNDPLPIPPSNPPYELVNWGPGFSDVTPLNGDPELNIDPATGILTGVPQQQGQYVVGVCVEEWRDGVLLGVNKRDFQFNVAPCEASSEVILADVENEDLCDDLNFTFQNLGDPDNEYVWDYGDPTTDDDVEVSYNGEYTYPDTGTYVVTVVSNPGVFCSDTSQIILPVYFDATIEIEDWSFECIDGNQVYSFSAGGSFEAESQVIWDFGDNATPQILEGVTVSGVSFSNTGPQMVQVEAINNICSAQNSLTFNVAEPASAEILPQEEFCQGLQVSFQQESQNVTIFNWDFGDESIDGDVSSLANPSFTYDEPGLYTVTLTTSDVDNCPVTVQETFDVQTLLNPEIPDQEIACFDNHAFGFSAGGSFSPNASFEWSFPGGTPATSTDQNPDGITYPDIGEKTVTLTVSDNGCVRSAENTVELHPNPIAAFNAFPEKGCAPLNVSFANESISESTNLKYEWDFGDGSTSLAPNPVHEFTQPGIYSISLALTNQDGCIDSSFVLRENLVEVTPSINASFSVEPQEVSVLDPVVEVIGLSEDATTCTYTFDGQEFNSCNFVHTLTNIEPQTIHLVVENEFGCSGRAQTEITLTDHLVYIPNAFTPDGDGLNDRFRPSLLGITQFRMWIFDRWGKEVFYTEDPQGWNGQGVDGTHYVNNGVYAYKIIVTDYAKENFEFTGAVRVIR